MPCLDVVCEWLQGLRVVESFIAKNTKIFFLFHTYAYLAFFIATVLKLGLVTLIIVRFSYRNECTYI